MAFLSPPILRRLLSESKPIAEISGLQEIGSRGSDYESIPALKFLLKLYRETQPDLEAVLKQREIDRKFIDERVRACAQFNKEQGREITDHNYKTIIGLQDSRGRIVFGPHRKDFHKGGGRPIAPIPDYLQGPHVTLFGPPDSAKMAINAMNSYHRKLSKEPKLVEEILAGKPIAPKWGADDEDSKTPLRGDLVDAGRNLSRCFDRTLKVEGDDRYNLAQDHLAAPIKRFPGIALPCTFLFYQNQPMPLHLYDFALHVFENWHTPEALVFYVPKLENEEEAAYIHKMVATAEDLIRQEHPEYKLGTIRLMIVLENPRAIVRIHEIIDALHPYFVGASLGWHDFLASTARLFKEDSQYRIPVKADPDIVIKYIKASHELLAEVGAHDIFCSRL